MKKLPKCLLLASLFALGLTGCDKPGTSTSESTPTTEPTETASPTESESNASPTDSPSTTPVKEAHAITVSEVTGAKVTADKTEAKEGETVTITITEYAEDKVFGSIAVNDGAVIVNEVTRGEKYTFTMPDGEVTVKVTIANKVYEAHALTVNAIEGFTVKFFKGNEAVTEAVYRDAITVKVESTSATQRFKDLTSADVTLTKASDGIYTFTMPDKAVALTLTVENIPSHSLNSTLGKGVSNATFKVNGVDATAALEGATVVFSFLFDSANYTIEEIVWTGISDPTVISDTATAKAYQFVMPTGDVSVQVKTAEIPSYAITIDPVEHGSVEASVDGEPVTSAKAGELITLDLTADTHYKFKSLTVTSGETEIDLTTVAAEAKYTFEMPAGPVKITFVTEYVEQYFKINSIEAIAHNEIISDIKVGDQFLEGSEVELTVKDGESYYIDGYSLSVNGVIYEMASENYGSEFTATFTMPSADADIVILPVEGTSETGATLTGIDYDPELVSVYGLTVNEKYSLSNTVYFYVIPERGVKITGTKYYTDDSTYGSNCSENYSIANLYNIYSWGSYENFRIEITAEYVGTKTVTLNPVEGAIVDIDEKGYTPGNQVKIKIEAEPGYYIKDAEAEREDGSYFYASYYNGVMSFTMPEDNVILTVEVGQTVNASIEDHPNIASAYISDESYGGDPIELSGLVPGETYYVYATPAEGYEIVAIYYQDGKECYESWSNWSFTAPEDGEINITFEVAQRHVVTFDESEAYEVTRLEDDYLPGDEVEFKVAHSLGHKVTGITTNIDGLVITEDQYTPGIYTFTMPNQDVEIIIATEEVATHTLTYEQPTGMGSVNIRDGNGNVVASGDQVNEGEPLTMGLGGTATGFTLQSVELVVGDARTPLTAGTGGEYEFAMPSSDASIAITVTEEAKHPITLGTEDERLSIVIREQNGYGEEFEQGYVGHNVYVTVSLNDPTGNYYLDAEKFTVKTKGGVDVETNNPVNGRSVTFNFTMPDDEVIITPAIAQYETYAPTYVGDVTQYLYFSNGSEKTDVIDPTDGYKQGRSIRIWLKDDADDSKKYTVNVYYMDGETKVSAMSSAYKDGYTFYNPGDWISFSVPAADYVIELTIA